MKRLFLALGNPLRGDDGVARRVLELLDGLPEPGARLALHQLTPEVAAELAGIDEVFFLDADAIADSVAVEPRMERMEAQPPLGNSHDSTPAAVVYLARELFGFQGTAYLCRVPARDFAFREWISDEAEAQAQAMASRLQRYCAGSSLLELFNPGAVAAAYRSLQSSGPPPADST